MTALGIKRRLANQIPGSESLPVVGDTVQFKTLPQTYKIEDFGQWAEMHARYPTADYYVPEGMDKSKLGRTWLLVTPDGHKILMGTKQMSFTRVIPKKS